MTTKKPINKEIKSLKQKEERLRSNLALAQETLTKIDNNDKSVLLSGKTTIINSITAQLTQRNTNYDKPLMTKRNGTHHNKNNSKSLVIDNNISNPNTKPKPSNKKGKCSSLVNVQNYLTGSTNKPNQQLSNRLEQSIQRMAEQNKLREEKKMFLKEKYIAEENKIFNKTTKKVSFKEAEKIKEKFIERLKKTEQETKQKKKQIELEKKKKEEMILLQSQTKKKTKQEVILKQINEMFEWNKKRKDKIRLIKSQEDLKRDSIMKECFKPKICENSKKIAQKQLNKSTESAFDRLYHDDEKRQQKREILQSLYKPSFTPVVNNKRRILNSNSNSRTITINDYCDLTTHCDVEELLRNKVYQNRKNKTIEIGHLGLPVLTETTPFFNNSHLSEHSKGGKQTNSSSRKLLKSNGSSNSKKNQALNTINVENKDKIVSETEKEKAKGSLKGKTNQLIKKVSQANDIKTITTPLKNQDEDDGEKVKELTPSSSSSEKVSKISKNTRSRNDDNSLRISSRSYSSRSYSNDKSNSSDRSKISHSSNRSGSSYRSSSLNNSKSLLSKKTTSSKQSLSVQSNSKKSIRSSTS